ncbi:hypothetical protein PR003_g32337 [Phytophthora rubi]|uniref:Secreted protein n=1 Tax=Phytophthora rubi TaxID=129364 RepID=A0A6A4AY28_9STRA|nr:hypothetical protein PR003_g32337 [Phytophthora rubi]
MFIPLLIEMLLALLPSTLAELCNESAHAAEDPEAAGVAALPEDQAIELLLALLPSTLPSCAARTSMLLKIGKLLELLISPMVKPCDECESIPLLIELQLAVLLATLLLATLAVPCSEGVHAAEDRAAAGVAACHVGRAVRRGSPYR